MADAARSTSSSSLTVAIHGANDAPVAVADTASATEVSGLNNGTAGVNPSGKGVIKTSWYVDPATAAIHGGDRAHPAISLLNDRNQRITQEHRNRSTGLSAGDEYGLIVQS